MQLLNILCGLPLALAIMANPIAQRPQSKNKTANEPMSALVSSRVLTRIRNPHQLAPFPKDRSSSNSPSTSINLRRSSDERSGHTTADAPITRADDGPSEAKSVTSPPDSCEPPPTADDDDPGSDPEDQFGPRPPGVPAPFLEGNRTIPDSYIVVLFDNYTYAQHFAFVGNDLSTETWCTEFDYLTFIHGYHIKTSNESLIHENIRMDPGVEYVEADKVVSIEPPGGPVRVKRRNLS